MVSMYQARYTRAFSLAELLVVIAIIGILSTIVLASLNSARIKGNDTAIKANLSTIQIQGENFYGSNTFRLNTYGNASVTGKCVIVNNHGPANNSVFRDSTIQNALLATANISGSSNMYCYSSIFIPSYAIEAMMSDGNYWCIDSVGNSGIRAALIDSSGSTMMCPSF